MIRKTTLKECTNCCATTKSIMKILFQMNNTHHLRNFVKHNDHSIYGTWDILFQNVVRFGYFLLIFLGKWGKNRNLWFLPLLGLYCWFHPIKTLSKLYLRIWLFSGATTLIVFNVFWKLHWAWRILNNKRQLI